MGELFAGFVCGYILALISTPLLAVLLLRLRASSPVLARLLPEGTSAVSVSILLHLMLFFAWTGLGIILGLVLLAMRDEPGALGSSNAAFTLFVAGLTLMLLTPFVFLIPRLRHAAIACAVLMLVVFGWLMPHMAGWTSFEDSPAKRSPERFDFDQARS